MAMKLYKTSLKGVVVVDTDQFVDNRGSFIRLFCNKELEEIVGSRQILQINCSMTCSKGAVRGMHFQLPPHTEMKLVRCLKGRVFDVAVDLRANSPTFLKWHGEELSPENRKMLVVPEDFAHGFQVLDADSELVYLVTSYYQPASEGGIMFDDPRVAIKWPLPVVDLSMRDLNHPYLNVDYKGIKL